jgi:3-oxoadipate enol-lactonase
MTVTLHRVVEAAPELSPDAPTVLLLGSVGSTLEMWRPQLPALTAAYRVVRADTRGHGQSPVPPGPYEIDDLVDDALALLDDLGLGPAHIVGLSLGGMTALRLAAREPGRVDRLVVLCTSALLGPAQMWADRATVVRAGGMGAIADAAVARWVTAPFRAAHPDTVAWLRSMLCSQPVEGYAECCGAIERMDLRADLASISAPLLAIAGADDPTTTPDHLAAIADGVQDGRLLVIDEAAHLANVQQPAAINSAILAHLAGGTQAATKEHS